MTYRDIKATYRVMENTTVGTENILTSKEYYHLLANTLYEYSISDTTDCNYYLAYQDAIKTIIGMENITNELKWNLKDLYKETIETIKMIENKKGSC